MMKVKTGTSTRQVMPPGYVEPQNKKISVSEFVSGLSDEEMGEIIQAAKTDASINLVVERLRFAGEFVDLDSESMIKGIDALVEKGLITRGRADEIQRK